VAEEAIVAWPAQALDRPGVDRATYITVLTHHPKLEDAALTIVLRSVSPYVGAIGSRRAQAKRAERLRELGLDDDELARQIAPVRLVHGGTSPENRGRDHRRGRRGKERPLGNRMISTGGRIHGDVELERG
jgi:xanthine dehydrogenase accessory factor